jgi:hypothetical protein
MKKYAALVAILISGAGIALGAGTASAVSTDQYDNVRYWWCGAGTVEFTNVYGNHSQVRVGPGCHKYDYRESDRYGGYASASITNAEGGPVSCKIYVNGRIVAQSNDDSDYYSFASCY